jgi:uncharacterized protein
MMKPTKYVLLSHCKGTISPSLLLKLTLFLISLLLLLHSGILPAQDQSPPKQLRFSTPEQLLRPMLSKMMDMKSLSTSNALLKQLNNMAAQLSEEQINQQSMFNQTALLSMRQQHQVLIDKIEHSANKQRFYFYFLHSRISLQHQLKQQDFNQILIPYLIASYSDMTDEQVITAGQALNWSIPMAENYLLNVYKEVQDETELNYEQAIEVIVNTQLLNVLYAVLPQAQNAVKNELEKRFDITPEILIKTKDGVELAATIVKKKGLKKPSPAALQFTIYADEKFHINTATHAAAHGYVGIVVNSRGKRGSHNKIIPWEKDGEDATAAINWIAKQSWNDGQVVMYGGSYNGFTQWAAAKYMPKALKTIVPYAAASPITGLPIENGIVSTDNYEWAFHVTNNKTMDNDAYLGWQHSEELLQKLYKSGRSISDIDKLDGRPNPWFQKWLQHPDYDEYYQTMLPYQQDYARINIPVLSVTGYFDGGQISAIDFLKQHEKYNSDPQHYLLIGPYDHHTAQQVPSAQYGNYTLDPVALLKDTEEVVFEWFDHVLYGKPLPKLIKDKINYQLMGSNTWQYAPSYKTLNQRGLEYYLSAEQQANGRYPLTLNKTVKTEAISMAVDMADRSEERNQRVWPIIQDNLPDKNGLVFETEPFSQDMQFAGNLSGTLSLSANKKDVDIGYKLYEHTREGKYFLLVTYISRVSYAADMAKRKLLTPGEKTQVPLTNTRMTAKLLPQGSSLVLVLNVNKNVYAQVNMGTGKPVNEETIADAGEPLTLNWFSDSRIHIPLTPWQHMN